MTLDEQAYHNSYQLLVGKATYDDLGDAFVLPSNHEDPMVTIKYYESVEDYEKCSEILNLHKDDKEL